LDAELLQRGYGFWPPPAATIGELQGALLSTEEQQLRNDSEASNRHIQVC
jgi:hypothetical protein